MFSASAFGGEPTKPNPNPFGNGAFGNQPTKPQTGTMKNLSGIQKHLHTNLNSFQQVQPTAIKPSPVAANPPVAINPSQAAINPSAIPVQPPGMNPSPIP